MIVELKQEHIDHGVRYSCDCCAIALALNEATGREWAVQIANYSGKGIARPLSVYKLSPAGTAFGVFLNKKVTRLITQFDTSRPDKPIKPTRFRFNWKPSNART